MSPILLVHFPLQLSKIVGLRSLWFYSHGALKEVLLPLKVIFYLKTTIKADGPNFSTIVTNAEVGTS